MNTFSRPFPVGANGGDSKCLGTMGRLVWGRLFGLRNKGLIACLHHQPPRSAPFPTRTTPTRHFLHTQHFPPQHLPKYHLKSRAGSPFKRPQSQNWHVPKQHSSDSACKPRPGWPACVLSKRPRVVPVLLCVTLGQVGVVRTVDLSDKPNKPAPVATGPLGLLHAPSRTACASGVAVGQGRSFTRKCRAAFHSSLSAPTHKTQLLPLALGAQPRVGRRANRLPSPYQRQTICQRKICKCNKVELITLDFDGLNIIESC